MPHSKKVLILKISRITIRFIIIVTFFSFLSQLACRNSVEYRAVELCEELAPLKVVELAIKYAGRISRMALANRLESIAEQKDKDKEAEETNVNGNLGNGHGNGDYMGTNDAFNEAMEEEDEDITFTPESTPRNDVEIRPLFISPVVGARRSNPFLKSTTGSAKGICLNIYTYV